MGLILDGAVGGLGAGLASIGDSAMKYGARQDELAQRSALQRELQEEKLATQREIAADRLAAGGGGKSGPFIPDVKEGSMAEESMASRMGMSVPELRALRKANQTGDTSGLGADVQLPGPTEDGKPLTGKAPVDGKWLQDKRTALADIQQEFIYGDKYDDVAKGRRTEQGNKVAGGIINGTIKPEVGAQTIAATEGKGAYKEGGDTVYNEFNGKNDPTAVGKSVIGKNGAEANKDNAVAEQKKNGQDPERLKLITDLTSRERTLRTQMGRLQADPIIANDIKKGRPPAALVEMQDELTDVMQQRKSLQIGIVKGKDDNGGSAKERPPLSNFMKR